MPGKGSLWDSDWAPRGQAALIQSARVTMKQRQLANRSCRDQDIPVIDLTENIKSSLNIRVRKDKPKLPGPLCVDLTDQPSTSPPRAGANIAKRAGDASLVPGLQQKSSEICYQAKPSDQRGSYTFHGSHSGGRDLSKILQVEGTYGIPFVTGTLHKSQGPVGLPAHPLVSLFGDYSNTGKHDPRNAMGWKYPQMIALPLPTTRDVSMPTELLGGSVVFRLGLLFDEQEHTLDEGILRFYSKRFRETSTVSNEAARYSHVASRNFEILKSWLYTRRLDTEDLDLSQLCGLYITGSQVVVPMFTNFIINLIINRVIDMMTHGKVLAFSDINRIYKNTFDLPERFGRHLRCFFVDAYTLMILEGKTVFQEGEREDGDEEAYQDFNTVIGQSNTDDRLLNLLTAKMNSECEYHEHFGGRTCQS